MQIINTLKTNTRTHEENLNLLHSAQFPSMVYQRWSPKSTLVGKNETFILENRIFKGGGKQACGERKQKSGNRSWERKESLWGLDLDRERSSSRPQPNLSLALKNKTKKPHKKLSLTLEWIGWKVVFPTLNLFPILSLC